ncbi:class I SAM-dependent DNA methyltransferase [Candidatus Poribacteria bacterium]
MLYNGLKIYKELNDYHFHGANFDLFGAIYEEFASQTKKKEFGEFYTRRHITGMVAGILLRDELNPRKLRICDPACGAGGFLTEAYKSLVTNYSSLGRLNDDVIKGLREEIFWGYDNDEKSVARTQLNMFLVGDGHINIHEIDDSLVGWQDEIGWTENRFDYIMTNPPMGKYDGEARMEDFTFTNESRYEMLFVEKVIKAAKPGGEIAIIVNDGALEAPSRENFRKRLLKHCNIHVIISLTKFAFAPYTKEKTYILFMQRKQVPGEFQTFPIWHFILDYDGYANSDKRYKTKYHNDIAELEQKFDGAVKLARLFESNGDIFEHGRNNLERECHDREKEEGLWGYKCRYVDMEEVSEENFHNLLSEFYLRPVVIDRIREEEFDDLIANIAEKVSLLEKDIRTLSSSIHGDSDEDDLGTLRLFSW